MKIADWLDVVVLGALVDPTRSDLESELRISVRLSVYTLRDFKDDRHGLSGLSKIAHYEIRRVAAALSPPVPCRLFFVRWI
jgi:hypothetical protein